MNTEFLNYISLVKRLYDQTMQPVCDRYGITRMELDILLFLNNNPHYDTATGIIQNRRLTKSHVSASVKSMEEHGYLERFFEKGNGKTIHLKVSPSADNILESGLIAQKTFFNAILADISTKEQNQMEQNLNRLIENAQRALRGGTEL